MAIDEVHHVPADDLVVERLIDLDIDAAELWDLVSTPEGWQRWLVDGGQVDLHEGGGGRVLDGEVERDVRIAAVEVGRSITFTWWERDDPSTASEVSISIVHRGGNGDGEGDVGPTGLRILERIPAARIAASASATAARADVARFAWEVRACVLWAGTRSTARV